MYAMKTPITVLQEMTMKLGETPEYECVSQSGPHHHAMFEYVCRARGETARGAARSKKEAKQEAARALLARLAATGARLPPECADAAAAPAASTPTHSYVALLKELCEDYKLPAADYELVGDTGPPHLRQFTIRATLGQHSRLATASTKKAARQLAAEDLYHYLRENLKRTRDFVEEEALVRHHEKVMERYHETRSEQAARPRLAQRVADYHLGLHDTFDSGARSLALEALAGTRGGDAELELASACTALGVQPSWAELAAQPSPLHVVSLSASAPQLAFAGSTRARAAAAAAAYLRRALPDPPPASRPLDLLG